MTEKALTAVDRVNGGTCNEEGLEFEGSVDAV